MGKTVVLFALVACAGFAAMVALGQASTGRPAGSTAVGTTVSSNVVVHSSSSCSVSVKAENGVTTTTKAGNCASSSSCSVSVVSVNGVTTTTKSGDCTGATITTGKIFDVGLLRTVIAGLFARFGVAGVL
jgi:hypothetical protein